MMKTMIPLIFLPLLLLSLSACGSSRPVASAVPQQTQRYDPALRAWVPVSAPQSAPRAVSAHVLEPERAGEGVKILGSSPPPAPPAPAGADTAVADADEPGMMQRMRRAASSPLRWMGLGGDAES